VRTVESSDPESGRLAEQIDAGRAARVLRLRMSDGCSVGAVWLIGLDTFAAELLTSQHVSVSAAAGARPDRHRRRWVVPLGRLAERPLDVGCDHVRELLDTAALRDLVAAVTAKRLRLGASQQIPTL